MKYNQKLNMMDYLVAVDSIADGFFDNGIYQPHIGELNAMRVFYNMCVEHEGEIDDIDEFQKIVDEEDLPNTFFDMLDEYDGTFCFANAYSKAMEIVNYKKRSVGTLIDLINAWLAQITKNYSDVLSEDTINTINSIADKIDGGKSLAQAAVEEAGIKTEIIDIHSKE